MSQKVFTNGSWKQLVHGVPYATTDKAGVVKVGSGLEVAADGTISVSESAIKAIIEQRLASIYMYAKDDTSPEVDPPVEAAS